MLWYLAIQTFVAVCSDTAAGIKNGSDWYHALALAVGNAFALWTIVCILMDLLGRNNVFFETFVMCVACGLALHIDSEAKDFFRKGDRRIDG